MKIVKQGLSSQNSINALVEKTGPPDHFRPILTDWIKSLVFRGLLIISHSGEGWLKLLVFPLNGAEWDKSYITHETIMKRGIQEFLMGSVSDSGWATSAASFPRNTLSEF